MHDPTIPRFDFDDYNDSQCKYYFRFQKQDLLDLAEALRNPEEVVLSNRIRMSGTDALCMTLRRLSYPNRLVDRQKFFDWPKTTISMVANNVMEHIHQNFEQKLLPFGSVVIFAFISHSV